MAIISARRQQAARTTYQLSRPSCSTRAIQKSLLMKNVWEFIWEKTSGEWTISRKQDKTERARGLGRKKQERWQKREIKWQPWDSRQGRNIRHPWPPCASPSPTYHLLTLLSVGAAWRDRQTDRETETKSTKSAWDKEHCSLCCLWGQGGGTDRQTGKETDTKST